jgi:RNA polymerase sigma-70 factor (ECF subfamily)
MADAPETRPSLLVRLRDPRDGTAWAQFVEVYAPLIYGFARKHGLQDADAADLTQEVLQAVAGAVGRLDYDPRRGSFHGWLFTVVRNRLRNFLRGRAAWAGDATEALDPLHEPPAPEPDADALWREEYERRLFAWAAEQVRSEVEESTWRAFWLTGVEGRGAKAAAGELGLTVAAVYMAKSRVLARIKEHIRQLQGEASDD